MTSRAVYLALERRIRVLGRELPAAAGLDMDAIHHCRVASRRLREALAVAVGGWGPDFDRGLVDCRRRVRQLTRALGIVRELDVAIAILDESRAAESALVRVSDLVRASVEQMRASRRVEMLERLRAPGTTQLPARLDALLTAIEQTRPMSGVATAPWQGRIRRRVSQLEEAVGRAGMLYAVDRLHAVRIATKKLRYALELAQETSRTPTRRLVARLKRVQDLLGRLHDLEVVAALVRPFACGTDPVVVADAERLLERLAVEARERHADYLAATRWIGGVVDACRASRPRPASRRRRPSAELEETRCPVPCSSCDTPSRPSAATTTRTTRSGR